MTSHDKPNREFCEVQEIEETTFGTNAVHAKTGKQYSDVTYEHGTIDDVTGSSSDSI